MRYINILVETLISIHTQENTMKAFFNSIWNFFCAIGTARYAADLARNGKIKEAQALFKD